MSRRFRSWAVGLGALLAGGVGGRAGDASTEAAWHRHRARSMDTLGTLATAKAERGETDSTVAELLFTELFEPVGDEGLRYATRAQALAGKRVRLSGFMVRSATRPRGYFQLVASSRSVPFGTTTDSADLPPAVVTVCLPETAAGPVPYVPGRITVTGVLELGARPEPDGRNSAIRIRVDQNPFGAAVREKAMP